MHLIDLSDDWNQEINTIRGDFKISYTILERPIEWQAGEDVYGNIDKVVKFSNTLPVRVIST